MIGLLYHIVPFIECRQLTVSTVIILTCSALFCLLLCSVTIKAPHISHETVLHAATLSFYSVCEQRTRNHQRGYYTCHLRLCHMLKTSWECNNRCHQAFLGSGTRSEVFFAVGPRLQKQSVELNQMMAFLYSS